MKRAMPFDDQVDISSDESSSSELDIAELAGKLVEDISVDQPTDIIMTIEDVLFKSAQMYQDYMKKLPIPTARGAIVSFTSWTGFGNYMKIIYKQPLHYLTNVCLKKLDENRIGTDAYERLDTIIHPAKAEVFLWMTEQIHRLTTSPSQLAKLWLDDPMYRAFIDPYAPSV